MSPPKVPLPPDDDALRALYREGRPDDGPPATLDAAILAAAQAAVQSPKPAPRRARAWWQTWLAPVSVAAVAVVGLTLSLHVAEDPEFDVRTRRSEPPVPATAPAREAAPAAVPAPGLDRPAGVGETTAPRAESERQVPAARPAAPPPASSAAAGAPPDGVAESAIPGASRRDDRPKGTVEDRAASDRASAGGAAGARTAAPVATDPPARAAESGRPEAAAPAETRKALSPPSPLRAAPEAKSDAAEADRLRDAAGFDRRVAPSEPAKRSRQEAAGATAPAPAAAHPNASALPPMPQAAETQASRGALEADPARWIESIRALRAAGRDREATIEIARFRNRYPDFRLPADLAPK